MSSACQRVAWCVLQVGHGDGCRPSHHEPHPWTVDLLRQCEEALSKTREHNPWDLGPSPLLLEVRAAIGKKS